MDSKSNLRTSSRWFVKKLARRGIEFLSPVLDSVYKQPAGEVIRVLTYHRFGTEQKDAFCVLPSDFEEHLALLADQERAVSLEQVQRLIDGDIEGLPDAACLVTIDDGMLSTLTEALPLLRKYQIPAVAFVSSKLIGLSPADAEERYLTWEELKELTSCGIVTVGSHAHTHRSMASLSVSESHLEAKVSKSIIAENLGTEVSSFAYPFGMSQDFSSETGRGLRDAGYETAFTSMHGPVRAGMDAVCLPRVKVEGGESLKMFDSISRGGLDHWRMIDDRFWRLQRVRREFS